MPRYLTLGFYASFLTLLLLMTGACGLSEAGVKARDEAPVPGETEHPAAKLIPAAKLRSDLDFLYENLRQAHFNLFVHMPKEEYDRHYRELRASFDRPLGLFKAHLSFQRFMALGQVGHSRIDSPMTTYAAHRDAGGKVAPFYIRVKDDRVFVTESYGEADLRPGDRILTLNGQPIASWLRRTTAHLSADSAELGYALLEFQWPRLLWLELGEVEEVQLEILRGGSTRPMSIPMLNQEQIRDAAAEAPERLELDWTTRSFKKLEGTLAYLRPGPFYEPQSAGGYDPTLFHQFIDEAFESFLEAGATDVLIDIRDNPGGDNSFSDLMVSWFADRPFRFCSAFRIKVSPQTRASHRKRQELNPNLEGPSLGFAELYDENEDGTIVDFEMPFTEPRNGPRFEGNIYLLVNRHSFSNAVTVAALVQDYGFGLVIGEKTTDVATSYGAMEHFTLPATELRVGYPKAHLVRPNGDGRLRGVTPDIEIETPLIEGPEDPVLQKAVALIEARRSAP